MQIRQEKTPFLTAKYLRSCNTWSVNMHKMDVRKMDFKGLLMEASQSDVPAGW